MLKVDYEKAYDFVSQNYLRYILKRLGFGEMWMCWMEACIFIHLIKEERDIHLIPLFEHVEAFNI